VELTPTLTHDFIDFYTDACPSSSLIIQGKLEWILTRQIIDEL